MAWICPCGKTNSDDHGSCPSCGYQLSEGIGIDFQGSISEEQRSAQSIGIEWYQWATSEDARVRRSHRKMNHVLVAWRDPPSPEALIGEKSPGRYHAGELEGCRCVSLPVTSLDLISWPARVYTGGRIIRMSKGQFQRVFPLSSPKSTPSLATSPSLTSNPGARNGWTVGKFLGCLFLVLLAAAVIKNLSREDSTSTKHATTTDVSPANRLPAYAVGQEVPVGYWSYVCNRVWWTPVLSSGFSTHQANAAFLVVDIRAQNNDNSASRLPPLHLVDSDGRQYDHSTEVMLIDGFFGPLEKLNPGVPKEGLVAFDVPPNRHYSLVVSGGYRSEEHAVVLLPAPAPAPASAPVPQGQQPEAPQSSPEDQ